MLQKIFSNSMSKMKATVLLLITTLVLSQLLANGICSHPFSSPLGDLPTNLLSDILKILIKGTIEVMTNCTKDPKAPLAQYWLHNAKHLEGVELTNFGDLTGKPVKVLIHGWGGNKDIPYIKVIRDAYLQRQEADIITFDYGAYVGGNYFTAYCNLPAVAQNLALFLCRLDDFYNLAKVHVVGHSLGGQVSGLAGYKVQTQCGKTLGRITGLDPAGPLFEGIATERRLDSRDADFVDVIHTNQGQYGYLGNVGDIDFYPNSGFFQPGCFVVHRDMTEDELLSIPLSLVSCSHQRSCYLFAESIAKNDFYATADVRQVSGLEDHLNPNNDPTYMGEYCTAPKMHPSYFLKTKGDSPFGFGPSGNIQ